MKMVYSKKMGGRNMKKARIKDLSGYLNRLEKEVDKFVSEYQKDFYGLWNQPDVKKIDDVFGKWFVYWPHIGKYELSKNHIEDLLYLNKYIEENHFYWSILIEKNGYAVIRYGKLTFLIKEKALDIKEETDYSQIPIATLRGEISDNISMLPAELNERSLSEVQKESTTLDDKLKELSKEADDIKNAKTGELQEMQKQIDNLLAEMNKKKEVMMQELMEKKALFERKKQELEAQIYMLQTEIYSIRCFMGETVELIKIREGKKTETKDPVVLNQKILYLDEDLGRMLSLYQISLENYKLFEEAIKYNDEVFEAFCPQKKCITFFRVSRSAEISQFNRELNCIDSYEMLHGKKIGFAVRNGEELYLGWLEEEWEDDQTLTFEENVMLRAGKTEITDEYTGTTPIKERVSRMFAINVLRGLIANGSVLSIPAGEDLLKPSKYVIHNYADAWLDDNRYGDFATLVDNLHYYNRENDVILLITSLAERYDSYKTGPQRGLADAQVNRTHDCVVKSGLNKINMIDEEGKIYVSAVKKYSEYGARSNFSIKKSEFINLTFMNSLWLGYYIMTKKIGDFGRREDSYGRTRSLNYAYMIPYFKQALEYLQKREEEETLLLQPYVNLDEYNEWQVLLSHWKIAKQVHHMTEYQAKRFAKYLKDEKHFEIAHLFDSGYRSNIPDLHGSYSTTDIYAFGSRTVRWSNSTGDNHPLYGYGEDYEKARFDKDSSEKEIFERAKLDKEKLICIKREVDTWLQEKEVSLEEIIQALKKSVDKKKREDEKIRGHWQDDYARIYRKSTIEEMFALSFIKDYEIKDMDELTEVQYKAFLLYMEKNAWSMEKKLYPLCYYRAVQYDCFDRILEIANRILEERYFTEKNFV